MTDQIAITVSVIPDTVEVQIDESSPAAVAVAVAQTVDSVDVTVDPDNCEDITVAIQEADQIEVAVTEVVDTITVQATTAPDVVVVAVDDPSSGSSFLDLPDEIDDVDTTYFYMGWEDVSGWLVRRQDRAGVSFLNAREADNGAYSDLSSAWPDRASLTYA